MDYKAARDKAEEIVYVNYCLGSIVEGCKQRSISVLTKRGRPRPRADMEADLIEAMTKEFEGRA